MKKSSRTLQQFRTSLPPSEVLARAKQFFTRHISLYATYIEKDEPTYCTFRGQGVEEIVIGVTTDGGATVVSGSTYLYDMQVARFFTTLPPAAQVAAVAAAAAAGGAA